MSSVLSPSDIAKLRSKYPISEATARRNLPFSGVEIPAATIPERCLGQFLIRPSVDVASLNKTETRYYHWLKSMPNDKWIGVQCFTVKLGDDCRLTMDFAVIDENDHMRLIDTKAFNKKSRKVIAREDALIKIRCAARMYPFFRFLIAHEEDGVWKHHEIKP